MMMMMMIMVKSRNPLLTHESQDKRGASITGKGANQGVARFIGTADWSRSRQQIEPPVLHRAHTRNVYGGTQVRL